MSNSVEMNNIEILERAVSYIETFYVQKTQTSEQIRQIVNIFNTALENLDSAVGEDAHLRTSLFNGLGTIELLKRQRILQVRELQTMQSTMENDPALWQYYTVASRLRDVIQTEMEEMGQEVGVLDTMTSRIGAALARRIMADFFLHNSLA